MNIYTDGACVPNPGKGGWAYVIPELGVEKSGSEEKTTNNRMEMVAVIEALKAVPVGERAMIHSDSMLVVNVFSGKWKGKKNMDLILAAKSLMKDRNIEFEWVRGHNGHRWNERADDLANLAAGIE